MYFIYVDYNLPRIFLSDCHSHHSPFMMFLGVWVCFVPSLSKATCQTQPPPPTNLPLTLMKALWLLAAVRTALTPRSLLKELLELFVLDGNNDCTGTLWGSFLGSFPSSGIPLISVESRGWGVITRSDASVWPGTHQPPMLHLSQKVLSKLLTREARLREDKGERWKTTEAKRRRKVRGGRSWGSPGHCGIWQQRATSSLI